MIERFGALSDKRLGSPMEDPGLRLHPDAARRGHPVPLKRLVGVVKALDVPDVDLAEELQRTRVFATPTNS